VVGYDQTTNSVAVKPLIEDSRIANGSRTTLALPVINEVPVAFPNGGGYRITFPIQVGDVGWLMFADRSLDAWLATGREVDPVDDRDHDLNDAVFYPGTRPYGNALNAPTDCMSIGADDGPVIEIDGSEIRVGGAGAVSLVTKAEFDAHVHATAGTGAPSTPTVPITGTTILKGV